MVTKRKQIVKKKKKISRTLNIGHIGNLTSYVSFPKNPFFFLFFFFKYHHRSIYISWIVIHLTVQIRCVGREILVNHANENGIHFPVMDTLESSEVFRDNKRKTDTKAINQTIYILQIHYISWNVKKSRGIKPIQVENVPLSCNKAGKKTVITQ